MDAPAVGLDVRLVPAVPIASGLAVNVEAVEAVVMGLDVQSLDSGRILAVLAVEVQGLDGSWIQASPWWSVSALHHARRWPCRRSCRREPRAAG